MQTDPSKPNQTTPATHGATFPPDTTCVTITPARPGKLLRLPVVEERCAIRKSSIYAGCKAKTFPAPVRLSARTVAWREEDIDAWIAARTPAGSK